MTIRHSWTAPMLLAVAACSASGDLQHAENEVAKFHEMFNESAFEVLYVGTAKHLKQATSEKDFVTLLEAVHRRLGTMKSTSRSTWSVETDTSNGELVKISYHSVFDKGEADEDFTFEIQSQRAVLGDYVVHSRALLPE